MKKYILLIISIIYAMSAMAQCADNGNYWAQSWVSCVTSDSPNPNRGDSYWIMYEFHEPHYIDSCHVWNANRAGESGWGAKDVVIDYSEDGSNWIELGQYVFPRADESDDYMGFDGPNFEGVLVQQILVTILSTHDGGNCASLAELQFQIDTSQCYGIIDVCGVCNGPGEITWYLDADEDGRGDPNISVTDCDQPDGYVADSTDLCDNGALGWDDIANLFSDNGCNGCHGQNAAGGLNLRTYETTILGGNLCGTDLMRNNNFVQAIITPGYDGCGTAIGQPSMNDRASGEFDADELAKLQAWINGGVPEICTDYNFVIDEDGDGFTAEEDCDDTNADIYPGAEEIPNNGIDEDCDGSDLITSVFEINDTKISLYPNPVSERLHILVDGNLDHGIRIFNMDRKLIIANSNSPSSVNVSDLPAGLYIIEFEEVQSKKRVLKKIVVAK